MRQPIPFSTPRQRVNPALQLELNKRNCVAQFAAHGQANRKKLARYERRLRDWNLTMAGQRAPSPEAFHKPGSMQ